MCAIDTMRRPSSKKKRKAIVTKEVQENSTGSWESDDAEIGDKILYQSVITAADGNPSNYVFHDTMVQD